MVLNTGGIKMSNEKENQQFWSSSIEEVKNGYIEDKDEYKCLICGENFTKGRIYEVKSLLYDAKKATEFHIEEKHISMLDYLVNMNSSFTGITDVQKDLINMFYSGLSDKEISEKIGIAQSTIRNHRYKLREKEKQSKIFLAMMELLNEKTDKKINNLDKRSLCDAHKSAKSVDDRFNITDKEKEKVKETYFNEDGFLKSYPAREKKKIIVLEEIVKNFNKDRKYSEKEINRILKRIYEDYASIRRALIEYGYLERNNDCSEYWIKE